MTSINDLQAQLEKVRQENEAAERMELELAAQRKLARNEVLRKMAVRTEAELVNHELWIFW